MFAGLADSRCPVTTVPLHGPRPGDRTRRHDRAALCSRASAGQRLVAGVGDGVALGGCARHYLRTYRGVARRRTVSSSSCCLDRLLPALGDVLAAAGRAQSRGMHNGAHNRIGATDEAQRLLGRARSELEFCGQGCVGVSGGAPRRAAGRPAPKSEKRWRWSTFTPPRGWRGRTPVAMGRWSSKRARSDMWRLRVVHSTGYAYKSPVTASYNEARLTPRSDSRQNVILNRVEPVPATRSYRYVDYWGTAVTAFDLHAPHTDWRSPRRRWWRPTRGSCPPTRCPGRT